MEELTVSKEKFLKVAEVVKKDFKDSIPFTFVFGSLFPTAWERVQEALRKEHLAGYLEAKEEMESENKRNN